MDTQNELKEFFVNFFVPIDNIPEDTAWRNSISMEARASMLIDNASLEELSSLFNVCINENVLTLQLPVPLSDRKSTRLNSSHEIPSRMPSSA